MTQEEDTNMPEPDGWPGVGGGTPAEEYVICQRRGHQRSGMMAMSNPPYDICKWCGVRYRFTEPELVELGVPTTD